MQLDTNTHETLHKRTHTHAHIPTESVMQPTAKRSNRCWPRKRIRYAGFPPARIQNVEIIFALCATRSHEYRTSHNCCVPIWWTISYVIYNTQTCTVFLRWPPLKYYRKTTTHAHTLIMHGVKYSSDIIKHIKYTTFTRDALRTHRTLVDSPEHECMKMRCPARVERATRRLDNLQTSPTTSKPRAWHYQNIVACIMKKKNTNTYAHTHDTHSIIYTYMRQSCACVGAPRCSCELSYNMCYSRYFMFQQIWQNGRDVVRNKTNRIHARATSKNMRARPVSLIACSSRISIWTSAALLNYCIVCQDVDKCYVITRLARLIW